MRRFIGNGAGTLLIVLLAHTAAWAQATAQVSGTVRDSSGGVLPGVTVTVTQTDTGFMRTVVTENGGPTSCRTCRPVPDPRIMQFGIKYGF